MKKKRLDMLCIAKICAPRDIVDGLGWVGALCVLTAYGASSFGYLAPTNPVYQGLNLFGALGVVISTLPRKAYQATTLNLVWASVALLALLMMVID